MSGVAKKPKYLFLANGNKDQERYESKAEYVLNSFINIPVETAEKMGYEVYVGVNARYARNITCDHPNVKLRNVEIYRNPFHIREVYKSYRNVMNVLSEGGFEVIHCNTPIGGVLGRICGRRAGVKKVIYTAHGFHFFKGAPLINWLVYYPIERIMAHNTDALLTMNHEDYRRAKKFRLRRNGKVYYIPGVGIDLKDFENIEADKKQLRESLGLAEDDFVLIDSGDLVARKNYEMAIRVVAACHDKKVHLLICGQGNELEKLKKLASELKIDRQIHFLGFRTDMKELLKIADAFLFTTLQEGLPRSLMEAMASGLPVVGTRIRGNVDLIDENGGYLVEVNDIKGAAEKVKMLKKSPEKAKQMGEYNKKRIKKFSSTVVRTRMEKIYKDIVE